MEVIPARYHSESRPAKDYPIEEDFHIIIFLS